MSAHGMLLDLAREYRHYTGRPLGQVLLHRDDLRTLHAELGAQLEYLMQDHEVEYFNGIKLSQWGDPVEYTDHLAVIGLAVEDHRMNLQSELGAAYGKIDELRAQIRELEDKLKSKQVDDRAKSDPYGRYFRT